MGSADGSEGALGATALHAGVKVWVPDAADAWIAAEVLSVSGDQVKVAIGIGKGKSEKAGPSISFFFSASAQLQLSFRLPREHL